MHSHPFRSFSGHWTQRGWQMGTRSSERWITFIRGCDEITGVRAMRNNRGFVGAWLEAIDA